MWLENSGFKPHIRRMKIRIECGHGGLVEETPYLLDDRFKLQFSTRNSAQRSSSKRQRLKRQGLKHQRLKHQRLKRQRLARPRPKSRKRIDRQGSRRFGWGQMGRRRCG